ncbi:MAG: bifunctional proline dehydrogenase/L-glutamate gamma-semialdehyde dehydrogenase PutA, partial [Pseudolabrys sp.]|nr:bifunctional proline dehydrogenase/L-glutamate gamma-semialdehyde dehydrogenase PutA [Pseudolabrys sp.]
PSVPIPEILKRPSQWLAGASARHPRIPLPGDLYAPERRNSSGIEFGERVALEKLVEDVRGASPRHPVAAPLVDGKTLDGTDRAVISPIDGAEIGGVTEASGEAVTAAMATAQAALSVWNATSIETRAATLTRAGDLIERHRARLIALLQIEGGKTLDDCVSEVREATDLCRYYAVQAKLSLAPRLLPGPTGESNELRHRGRGVFVCISPWNFPLAIFTGQIAAALAAGNAVVAKPAEQTPLIASEAIKLLHQAGVPTAALHLVPGDGKVGAALVADVRTAGIAFTGSTEVARNINRALASKDGPIVPLIAETGGINAMIVDATALPEQVCDDVVTSAFRSAGQRCSALRLLCVQDDVAERVVEMIAGATRELSLGDPRDPATHIGPVIDADAWDKLGGWIGAMESRGSVRFRWDSDRKVPVKGTYVPPVIVELGNARELTQEVFGPILHVVKWRAGKLDALLDDIAANGYGLTLGVHSRIDATVRHIAARLSTGNIYVNRSMIGAVVGTQPFGGNGLSGTGPKAGGPEYLRRFALEQVVTVNTAAAGGNAALLAGDE